jgi:hypothetical protein
MYRSYAVTWQESGGSAHSGKLEIRATGLSLEGGNGRGPVSQLVPYGDLDAPTLAATSERIGGRPTLVFDRRRGGVLRIAGVGSPGILSEVAEHVAAMRNG